MDSSSYLSSVEIPTELKTYVQIQDMLYSDNPVFVDSIDVDPIFYSMMLCNLVKIRPFLIDRIVENCLMFSEQSNNCLVFQFYLLRKGLKRCPVLIYKLFRREFFSIESIIRELKMLGLSFPCYYFMNFIPNFQAFVGRMLDNCYEFPEIVSVLNQKNEENNYSLINSYREFGFPKDSIGFCIKYDLVDDLTFFNLSPHDDLSKEWTLFEWSVRPSDLGLLSVAASFGAINVFKHLISIGFMPSKSTFNAAIMGGSHDILHIIGDQFSSDLECLSKAMKSCRRSILDWLIQRDSTVYPCVANNYDLRTLLMGIQMAIGFKECEGNSRFPMHFAAKTGNLNLVKYMDAQGIKIIAKNKSILDFLIDKHHFM